MSSARPGGRRGILAAAAAAVLALGALLAGCGEAGTTTSAPENSVVAPPSSPLNAPAAPVDGVKPLARSTPTRVVVPAIGVDSDLVSLGLNSDHSVQVPPLSEPMQAGWYRYAPTPGAVGPAVILGHIDGGGQKGVFYRLQDMTPGMKIRVTRADGQVATFTVTEARRFPKSAFPTQRVYGETKDAELRLISCGGALDRAAHSYVDNIVVFATLTGTSRT